MSKKSLVLPVKAFYLCFFIAFIFISLFMGEMAVVGLFSIVAIFFLSKLSNFNKSAIAV